MSIANNTLSLNNTSLFLSLIFVLLSFNIQSQNSDFPKVTLDNTEVRNIKSSIVNDEYQVFVSLPFGYNKQKNKYKTLYVLDANVTFGMVNDIQKLISFEKGNPPLIIIGIAYKNFSEWIKKRGRDYMASNIKSVPGSGGAKKHFDFLQQELIPFVENNYHASSNDRIIYGHSTAALFGLYTLFNKPEIFSDYILTSPSIDEDEDYTFNLEKSFFNNNKNRITANLFLSYGIQEKESFISKYKLFAKTLKKRKYDGLNFKSTSINGTHMSSMSSAFTQGLVFMFQQKRS